MRDYRQGKLVWAGKGTEQGPLSAAAQEQPTGQPSSSQRGTQDPLQRYHHSHSEDLSKYIYHIGFTSYEFDLQRILWIGHYYNIIDRYKRPSNSSRQLKPSTSMSSTWQAPGQSEEPHLRYGTVR
ncbi:unnamed protein product [Nezara viridula]|uniref:Uncharacterized protein n=1 Tax=Nezara viridula TaxID=85310 RepID=A0A9P0HMY4_NEZVI|nr:unnamed protein product [Nezara viridula]